MNFFGDGDYSDQVASVNMNRSKYDAMLAMN